MNKGAHKSPPVARRRRRPMGPKANGRQYQVLFDSAGEAIFIHDREGQILAVNPAACKQYGYTQPELLAMTASRMVVPEKRGNVRKHLAQMMEQGWLKFPSAHQRKDGTSFPVEVNARRITWNGQAAIMSICRDTTEQNLLTEEMRREHDELQIIFDSSPTMIFFKDTQNRLIRVNQAFATASGYGREAITGQIASKLYPHQNEHYWEDDKQVIATGRPKTGIIEPLNTPEGVKWLQTTKVPYRDKDGRITGLIGFALDITERKKMEDALRESEELFNTAFHAIPEPVAISALDDERYMAVNNAFVSVLGFSEAEIVGRTALELKIWVKPAERQGIIRRLKQGDRIADIEVALRRKSGAIFPALVSAELIKISRQTAMLAVARDISALKQSEAEREKLSAEMSRTNQELETLIRIASHDLRSPLVNIQGFNQILNKAHEALVRILTDASLPDETRQALGVYYEKASKAMRFINAGVEKMNGLVSGLLRLSQLGRAPLVLQPLNMNMMMQTVVEAMAFQIRASAAKVEVDPLPGCRADPALINQVFTNLMDNAIKYRDGVRPLRIRIWGRRENDAQSLYCVEDNGVGVAPEHQKKIWNLFYQLSPQRPGSGDGIGLAAVQRIVQRHGGQVWMESEAGHGSRFFLTLAATAKEMEI